MFSTITKELKVMDGVYIFSPKEYPNWYGIEDIGFIWRGEWADPEIEYKGKVLDSIIIENTMWERYNIECKEKGIECNEDYFDNHYMKEHSDEIYELIELALEISI